MSFLFGHLYPTPCRFTHDQMMFELHGVRLPENAHGHHSVPSPIEAQSSPPYVGSSPREAARSHAMGLATSVASRELIELPQNASGSLQGPHTQLRHEMLTRGGAATEDRQSPWTNKKRRISQTSLSELVLVSESTAYGPPSSSMSRRDYANAARQEAHDAALEDGGLGWHDVGLVSVCGHQQREYEL